MGGSKRNKLKEIGGKMVNSKSFENGLLDLGQHKGKKREKQKHKEI